MTNKTIDGLKELESALIRLDIKSGSKVLRTSLRDAAKPMADSIKEDLPVDEGDLSDSVRVSSGIGGGKKKYSARARILIGGKTKNATHAAKIEFGYTKQSGTHVPANPVVREAAEKDAMLFVDRFKDQMTNKILKANRGNNGKSNS